jgi:hypothetical protein
MRGSGQRCRTNDGEAPRYLGYPRRAHPRPSSVTPLVRSTPTPRTGTGAGRPSAPQVPLDNCAHCEVRRARFGPGLWPGPCRQARWAGRGSRVNGAPQARPA